jgi:cysteine-rich repeat protein
MRNISATFALVLALVSCKHDEEKCPNMPYMGTTGTSVGSGSGGIRTVDASTMGGAGGARADAALSDASPVPASCGDPAVPPGQSPDEVVFRNGTALGAMYGWTWPSWGKEETVSGVSCLPGNYDPSTNGHPCTEGITWESAVGLCLSGTVPRVPVSSLSESWGLSVGVSADKCGGALGKSYDTISFSVTGIPLQAIQAGLWQVGMHVMTPAGRVLYQAPDDGSGKAIPFTRFNTVWWNPEGGEYLRTEQVPMITDVEVFVQASADISIAVTDLCLMRVSFGYGGTHDADIPDGSYREDAFAAETICGDGIMGPGEGCDDGNAESGDGCSRLCLIETEYRCPAPGQPCIDLAVCGDGILNHDEICDDGNRISGDGCSADCREIE